MFPPVAEGLPSHQTRASHHALLPEPRATLLAGVYSTVGLYTIGQTPRPDLTEALGVRSGDVEFRVVGLLDGLAASQLGHPWTPDRGEAYPLETRLRNGDRVVVDAGFLRPRLQQAILEADASVQAHLVLCAGPFPDLTSQAPLIVPFDVGAAELSRRGLRTLEIGVPFAAQAAPAARKWEDAGFRVRVHDLGAKPQAVPVGTWARTVAGASDADAWVFDYVGLPPEMTGAVAASLEIPVFDLGSMALDALSRVLDAPTRAD